MTDIGMAESTTNLYRYEPLPKGNYIRLLYLYPDLPGASLTARLEVVTFDSMCEYECLSYVWGSDVTDSSLNIVADGPEGKTDLGAIPITKSLSDALNDLRQPSEKGNDCPRSLWADAVCINQQEMDEKNVQVPLMGQIYRNAEAVVVHLCSDPTRSIASSFSLTDEEFATKTDDLCWLKANFEKPMNWLTRTWVVQEAVLADHLCFLIGRDVVEEKSYWRKMSHIVTYFNQDSRLKSLLLMHQVTEGYRSGFMSGPRTRRTTDGMRPDPSIIHGTAFINLLVMTRGTSCRDPRDKVFAMLSLSVQIRGLGIVADYNRSVADVYTDLAHRFLTTQAGIHGNGLILLSCAYRRKIKGLPSYVPDWSLQDNLQPQNNLITGAAPMYVGPVPLRYRQGILIRCLSFGRLKEVQAFPQLQDDETSSDMFVSCIRFVEEFLDKCRPQGQPLGELMGIAFRSLGRALVDIEDLRQAIDDAWDEFFNWCCRRPGQTDNNEQAEALELVMRYASLLCERGSQPWASKMWVSDTGFIGNACEGAEVGDQIVMPLGGHVPLLVRAQKMANQQEGHGNVHERRDINVVLTPRSSQLIPAQIRLTPEQEKRWQDQRQQEKEMFEEEQEEDVDDDDDDDDDDNEEEDEEEGIDGPHIFLGPCYDGRFVPELEPLRRLQLQIDSAISVDDAVDEPYQEVHKEPHHLIGPCFFDGVMCGEAFRFHTRRWKGLGRPVMGAKDWRDFLDVYLE